MTHFPDFVQYGYVKNLSILKIRKKNHDRYSKETVIKQKKDHFKTVFCTIVVNDRKSRGHDCPSRVVDRLGQT